MREQSDEVFDFLDQLAKLHFGSALGEFIQISVLSASGHPVSPQNSDSNRSENGSPAVRRAGPQRLPLLGAFRLRAGTPGGRFVFPVQRVAVGASRQFQNPSSDNESERRLAGDERRIANAGKRP